MHTLNKIYSGIGSRKTPPEILEMMTQIAIKLNSLGYLLRTGDADGADTAFKIGAPENNREVYGPEDATPESIEYTSTFHPAWHKVRIQDRRFHGRNAQIILGKELYLPSDFCICWTPNGDFVGGTAQGLRICNRLSIPIFNLAIPVSKSRLDAFLNP